MYMFGLFCIISSDTPVPSSLDVSLSPFYSPLPPSMSVECVDSLLCWIFWKWWVFHWLLNPKWPGCSPTLWLGSSVVFWVTCHCCHHLLLQEHLLGISLSFIYVHWVSWSSGMYVRCVPAVVVVVVVVVVVAFCSSISRHNLKNSATLESGLTPQRRL